MSKRPRCYEAELRHAAELEEQMLRELEHDQEAEHERLWREATLDVDCPCAGRATHFDFCPTRRARL